MARTVKYRVLNFRTAEARKVLPVPRVLRELTVPQVLPVPRALRELTVPQVPPVPRALRDRMVPSVLSPMSALTRRCLAKSYATVEPSSLTQPLELLT